MDNLPNKIENNPKESRLVPFAAAAVVCFASALILGVGGWYLFGTNHHLSPEKDLTAVQFSNRQTASENANAVSNQNGAPNPSPVEFAPEIVKAPAGEIAVEGGEITLGGGKLPLRRVAVKPFNIGATEVTNAQYAEFIEATNHAAPPDWTNKKYPEADADKPVGNVSWQDANDYCEWLSKQINATVRLPSEAEWEMAAGGAKNVKYPWGDEWNDKAAQSRETGGKVQPVKSFPEGRTAQGAFDMVSNVWEWTSDYFTDEFGQPVKYENVNRRVIKGGSVEDKRDYFSVKVRMGRPETSPKNIIGFRYAVVRK